MKCFKVFVILPGICLMTIPCLSGQDCPEFLDSENCTMNRQRGYKTYSQSKSVYVAPKDTVEMNIVFYGQKDYILSFCSIREFFPVNFRLLDPSTRKIFYDNVEDQYIETLQVGFDATKSVIVQFRAIGGKNITTNKKDPRNCIGLLIQYRNQ